MKFVSLSLLTLWGRGKVETPGNLGFSRYDFLVRDNEAHAPDPGDGYHSQTELRDVLQSEYDAYERTGDTDKWDQYVYSKKMLDAMRAAKVDTVDYMPDELKNIDEYLRPRAVELLNISYEMRNGGRIDAAVLDRARMKYRSRCNEGIISDRARDKAIAQIDAVANFLGLQPA